MEEGGGGGAERGGGGLELLGSEAVEDGRGGHVEQRQGRPQQKRPAFRCRGQGRLQPAAKRRELGACGGGGGCGGRERPEEVVRDCEGGAEGRNLGRQ